MVTGWVLQEALTEERDRADALPSVGTAGRGCGPAGRKKSDSCVSGGKKRSVCEKFKAKRFGGVKKKFIELFHTSITETTVIPVKRVSGTLLTTTWMSTVLTVTRAQTW